MSSTFFSFFGGGVGDSTSSCISHTDGSHIIIPLLDGKLNVLEMHIVFYYDRSIYLVKNYKKSCVTILFLHSIDNKNIVYYILMLCALNWTY